MVKIYWRVRPFFVVDQFLIISAESFRLSYYPHRLDEFKGLLKEAFGEACKHTVFGDFKQLDEISDPAFYIHLVEKLPEWTISYMLRAQVAAA